MTYANDNNLPIIELNPVRNFLLTAATVVVLGAALMHAAHAEGNHVNNESAEGQAQTSDMNGATVTPEEKSVYTARQIEQYNAEGDRSLFGIAGRWLGFGNEYSNGPPSGSAGSLSGQGGTA